MRGQKESTQSDGNLSHHTAVLRALRVSASLSLGIILLWPQGMHSAQSGSAAEGDIQRVLESLPSGSELRRKLQRGDRGPGIHYPWMDHMRQLGVKRALVHTEFVWRGHPIGTKVLRIVYFSKYDQDCAQISDPERLAEIRLNGLQPELGQAALDRTAAAHWGLIHKRYRTNLGVGIIELLDDEWLPVLPPALAPEARIPNAFREAIVMDDVAAVVTLLNGPVGATERQNALFVTQVADDPCMTKALLKDGGEANLRNTDGYTLLMIAVRIAALRNVEALLAAGADVNSRTPRGPHGPPHLDV